VSANCSNSSAPAMRGHPSLSSWTTPVTSVVNWSNSRRRPSTSNCSSCPPTAPISTSSRGFGSWSKAHADQPLLRLL
jgi:hypothetical protein